ncbi:MAG: Spermidine synthase [bacterium ADurb.Bin478]|nr:MAG: Spermidine synthase [bacterium ADurb.Bin478]
MIMGSTATLWQLVLMREWMTVFYGNELIIGLVLSGWLLFVAVGCQVGDRYGNVRWTPALLCAAFILCLWIVFVSMKHLRVLAQIPAAEAVSLPRMLGFMAPALGLPCIIWGCWFSRLSALLAAHRIRSASTLIYIYEAAGAVVAGLAFTLCLAKWFDNFYILLFLSCLLCLSMAILLQRRRWAWAALAILAVSVCKGPSWDRALNEKFWHSLAPGVKVKATWGTRYGQWAVLDWGGETALYCNGLKQSILPDPVSNQGLAGQILTQHPHPHKVLLIAGGLGGLAQTLAPGIDLTYVEMDENALRRTIPFLNEPWHVPTVFQDGRRFLLTTRQQYDMIIINAGRPSTALTNRLYTREFHQLAKRRLNAGGVLAYCAVPAGENIMGPELHHLNSALYQDLASCFAHVLAWPGDAALYFACDHAGVLCRDPDRLAQRYLDLRRRDRYFHPQMFRTLVLPERLDHFSRSLQQTKASNRDERPVSYYLDWLIWLKQVSGFSAPAATLRPQPVLPIALVLSLGLMILFWLRRRSSAGLLMIMALNGLIAIAVNIIFLLMLQSLYGYVYEGMGWAVAAYMAGMTITAAAVHRFEPAPERWIPRIGLGTLVFLLTVMPVFRQFMVHSGIALFFLWLVIGGAFAGALFPLLNRLLRHQGEKNLSSLYAADLIGSSLGAWLVNFFAVPMLGFTATLHWLCGFCALALAGSVVFVRSR